MENIREHNLLNEVLHTNILSSGIKCYIIPKKGYLEKYAMIGINFGSVHNKFEIDGNITELPDGIAHYLEHKMFEDAKKDMMYEFSKISGNVNAFTNNSNTAYYFSCTENFKENYKLLLELLSKPHFTKENVERERGIIAQEISMYEDYPFVNVYLNMLDKMYNVCPVKKNIAGTKQSIEKITSDLLYKCYDSFYFPKNMAAVLVGDFQKEEIEEIYEMTNEYLNMSKNKDVKKIFEKEPDEIVSDYVEEKMSLSNSIFNFGFKETNFKDNILHRMVSSRMVIDILFGESSDFYEKLYNKNLINDAFGAEYTGADFFGSSVIGGTSNNPKEVKKYILDEINKYSEKGIHEERFLQIKKKHIGRFIKEFNCLETISMMQLDLFNKNIDIFGLMNKYMYIELNEVNERLKEHFTLNNNVLSVILHES